MGCPNTFENRRTEIAQISRRERSDVTDDEVVANFIDGVRSPDGFYRYTTATCMHSYQPSTMDAGSMLSWHVWAWLSATRSVATSDCVIQSHCSQVFVHGAIRTENYGWVPDLDIAYTANSTVTGVELRDTHSAQVSDRRMCTPLSWQPRTGWISSMHSKTPLLRSGHAHHSTTLPTPRYIMSDVS